MHALEKLKYDIVGGEFDYVILSTVRSLPETDIEIRPSPQWREKHIGNLLMNEQLASFLLTRARKGLLIVGRFCMLLCDFPHKKLIVYSHNNSMV